MMMVVGGARGWVSGCMVGRGGAGKEWGRAARRGGSKKHATGWLAVMRTTPCKPVVLPVAKREKLAAPACMVCAASANAMACGVACKPRPVRSNSTTFNCCSNSAI